MGAMTADAQLDGPKRRRNHALWIGPLLVFVGAVSYFTVFARYAAVRDFPWVNLPIVFAGLACSVIGVQRAFSARSPYRGTILGSLGLLFSLAITCLFCGYIFVLSYQLPAPTTMALDLVTAPDFDLPNQDGRRVRLSDLRGSKVVVTFYRGHW